ncbi:anhydro-N-acetylmuramic acid kinase [Candidatus Poribacteria bacterium]|nr:MAG: anhydro-N-acetylmuramic acid kinase [Candidatus Poribacteria bacterium]
MESFHQLAAKDTKKVIGLMSGTSVDGVDAALVEIRGHGLETQIELLAFHSHSFETEVRNRIFDLFQPETSRVDEICQMNFLIGEVFADAALAVMREAQLEAGEIDLIGSHGQTVYHLPPQPEAQYVPSTLQLGEPAVIAYRTGLPTIANFRVADVAAGGQGAPLVPYVDFLLFRQTDRTVALQNIGGISNVTLIPAGAAESDVLASDTGPGNMIIDSVMESLTHGKEKYDNAGKFAAQGRVCQSLLSEWLQHPFLSAHPPKTTGREAFGRQFADQTIQQAQNQNIGQADLVATVTAFTAETIFDYYQRFLFPHHSVDEIYISGGGTHNLTLMAHLKRLFQPIPLLPIDSIGFSSDAKEAIAFAVLANEAIHGNPTNLPQVTGASQPMVLGTFSPV